MSPKRLTCPKCNGELGPRILPSAPPVAVGYESPEFPCPHCDAILSIPKLKETYRKMMTILELMLTGLFSILVFMLATLVILGPHSSFLLLHVPILSFTLIFGSGTWAAHKTVTRNLKIEIVGIRPTCGNCCYISMIKNACFCTKCGAGLSNRTIVEFASEERLGTPEPRQEIPDSRKTSKFILKVRDRVNDMAAQRQAEWMSHTCQHCGTIVALVDAQFCPTCGEKLSKPRQLSHVVSPDKCMVCTEDLNPQDTITRCPNCGSPFHTIHLLEYLHVHAGCPVCSEHLAEREIAAISNDALRPLNDGGGAC